MIRREHSAERRLGLHPEKSEDGLFKVLERNLFVCLFDSLSLQEDKRPEKGL